MEMPHRTCLKKEHRTNLVLHAMRSLITSAIALALVACGGGPSTIVRVPASELPGLGPSTLTRKPTSNVVTSIDGSRHTINGTIERVELDIKKQTLPIALPFKARIQGDQLEVLTNQVRTYHVPDISYVAVQYTSSTPGTLSPARRNTGIGLLIGSMLPLGLGTYVVVESRDEGRAVRDLLALYGGGALLVGAGLFIAGVLVMTPSDPPPQAPAQRTKFTFVRPQLRVSPTGVSFSTEF